MSRKHFAALAAELANVKPDPSDTVARVQWMRTVRAVGNACYAANGRFDRDRFERACGI